jgi:hypothetical protein
VRKEEQQGVSVSSASAGKTVANKGISLDKKREIERRSEAGMRRLEELRRQKKQLARRQKVLQSRHERRLDARRKILIGAMTLDEADKSAVGQAELLSRMDRYLTRDDDRALFELPPLPGKVAKEVLDGPQPSNSGPSSANLNDLLAAALAADARSASNAPHPGAA